MEYPSIGKKRTGEKIRRTCALYGLTVKDIQEYLGLSCPQSVYRWFNGTSLPTIDNLYALSELLEVQIDDLLAGSRSYGSRRMAKAERLLVYCTELRQRYREKEAS